MKKDKIIYWVTTGVIGAMMLFSAYSYLTNETMKAGFIHLGFPSSFRIELAIAKIIGVILLLVPSIKGDLKIATYFGFALTFVSATIAHASVGDPMPAPVAPMVFLGILAVSFIYYKKLNNQQIIN